MVKDPKAYILSDDSPFAVQEGYRTLRTNIMFMMPDSGGKIIGITSANRGERKSSVTINTALSFAELGKKVLIVDCDLRLPTVASKLGIKIIPGLTDAIVGNVEFNAAIRKYAENCYVIPSGTIPKDATGILASEKLNKMLEALKEKFDYIFIDFPPVTTVTDATLLSKSIDGYMIAVHHETTSYKDIKYVKRSLELAGGNILGFIYTSAPVVSKKNYYYKKDSD